MVSEDEIAEMRISAFRRPGAIREAAVEISERMAGHLGEQKMNGGQEHVGHGRATNVGRHCEHLFVTGNFCREGCVQRSRVRAGFDGESIEAFREGREIAVLHRAQAKRWRERSCALRASSSRLRGGALVVSDAMSRSATAVTSSTA